MWASSPTKGNICRVRRFPTHQMYKSGGEYFTAAHIICFGTSKIAVPYIILFAVWLIFRLFILKINIGYAYIYFGYGGPRHRLYFILNIRLYRFCNLTDFCVFINADINGIPITKPTADLPLSTFCLLK